MLVSLAVMGLLYARLEARAEGLFLLVGAPEDFAGVRMEVKGPVGREEAALAALVGHEARIVFDRRPEAGWRTLEVKIGSERLGQRVYMASTDPTSGDETLRTALVGHRLWVFGQREWTEISPDPRTPVTLVGIRRLNAWAPDLSGPAFFIGTDWTSQSFTAFDPLVVKVRLARSRRPNEPDTAEIMVADAWQLWREASLVSPDALLSREPAVVREAFGRREVVPGMPRGLVRRLLGEPNLVIDETTSMRQAFWDWSGPAPDTYLVLFDRTGRATFAGMNPNAPRRP